MRIAYLSESIIPSRAANSVHVMKMCQAFAHNGHEVTLASRGDSKEGGVGIEDIFNFYGVNNAFELRRLQLPNVKGDRYIYAILAVLHALRFGADLVYGRCIHSCYAATLLRLPVIYEAHKLPEKAGRMTQWAHRHLLQSDCLIRLTVISNGLKQDYCEAHNVPESKVLIAHDAADDPLSNGERSSAYADSFMQNGRLQVGYVGSLYRGRGVNIISRLVDSCPWADFHIIGGENERVERWKRKTGNPSNVTFHGFVAPSKADEYRLQCDVLMAPYQPEVAVAGNQGDTAQWMSPLKLFEYMAAGKPILCSDLRVLREVLTHRENAWLCAPEEPLEWVEALAHLRDHPEMRKELGELARRDFEEEYNWDTRAKKVLQGVNP